MNLKCIFKLTNENTDEEYLEGDIVKITLNNGEIVAGELTYADGIMLSIGRREQLEEYDFGEIKNLEKTDRESIRAILNYSIF